MYNLTGLTDNANTWYDIANNVNALSNGILFTFVVIVLIVIYWVVFKKQNFKDVFLSGSFFAAFISTILFAMRLVTSDFLIIPWIMFFASIIIYLFNNN